MTFLTFLFPINELIANTNKNTAVFKTIAPSYKEAKPLSLVTGTYCIRWLFILLVAIAIGLFIPSSDSVLNYVVSIFYLLGLVFIVIMNMSFITLHFVTRKARCRIKKSLKTQ